jgi:hypothetical protein
MDNHGEACVAAYQCTSCGACNSRLRNCFLSFAYLSSIRCRDQRRVPSPPEQEAKSSSAASSLFEYARALGRSTTIKRPMLSLRVFPTRSRKLRLSQLVSMGRFSTFSLRQPHTCAHHTEEHEPRMHRAEQPGSDMFGGPWRGGASIIPIEREFRTRRYQQSSRTDSG